MDIAGSEFHAQTQTVAPFAGDDRSVRSLAMASLGDVTHRRAFLRTVGDQRCGIGIHNSAVEKPQAGEKLLTHSVVSGSETLKFVGTKAPKKAPQGVAVRKLRQAQKRRDQTVVNQRLGVLDPANSSHDSKEVSKKKVCGVITSVVIIGPAHVELQEVPQAQRFAKSLKQAQSTEAS